MCLTRLRGTRGRQDPHVSTGTNIGRFVIDSMGYVYSEPRLLESVISLGYYLPILLLARMSTELGEWNLATGDTGRAKQDIDNVTKKPGPFDASNYLAYSPQKRPCTCQIEDILQPPSLKSPPRIHSHFSLTKGYWLIAGKSSARMSSTTACITHVQARYRSEAWHRDMLLLLTTFGIRPKS
jgi:hypothetical protein